jgi:hypothetical protein
VDEEAIAIARWAAEPEKIITGYDTPKPRMIKHMNK